MTDLTQEELKKIKRVVLIDSTWSQTRHYMKDEKIKNMKMVKIQTEKTVFWRYQTGCQDTSLATIEALYFFFRDYEVALNCNKDYSKYNRKWDDLLWFYAYNYNLIQQAYTTGKKAGQELKHIPGYIQSVDGPNKRQKLDLTTEKQVQLTSPVKE